jgi:hypothetical protein
MIAGMRDSESRDSVIETMEKIEQILLKEFQLKVSSVSDTQEGAEVIYEMEGA